MQTGCVNVWTAGGSFGGLGHYLLPIIACVAGFDDPHAEMHEPEPKFSLGHLACSIVWGGYVLHFCNFPVAHPCSTTIPFATTRCMAFVDCLQVVGPPLHLQGVRACAGCSMTLPCYVPTGLKETMY